MTSEQRVRAHFSEWNGRGWLYSPATNTELWTFRGIKQEVKSHQVIWLGPIACQEDERVSCSKPVQLFPPSACHSYVDIMERKGEVANGLRILSTHRYKRN